MARRKKSLFRGWLTSVCVAAGACATALIPPAEVFGVKLHRTNVLSDISHFESDERDNVVEYEADIELLEQQIAMIENMQTSVAEQIDSTVVEPVRISYEWRTGDYSPQESARRPSSEELRPAADAAMVAIEDFDTLPQSRFDRFVERLVEGRPVRIAFMGDSFVEGDILTVDLRHELQTLFGGRGVGFVACDIPFATSRKSIKRRSAGWSSYSIMKPKAAPESLRDKFFVSGYMAEGGAGASTRWEITESYPTLAGAETARLLLLSREDSRVELTLNDTLSRSFDIEGDEALRQIVVESAPYRSIALKVLDGRVICYGVAIGSDDGIRVDNFSVRSNNGHAIFGTNPLINRQADVLLGGYDLVVLQYGLNIMQAGQRNYSKYRDQLRDMISYAERCFPDAAILVMGVSDRCVKNDESGAYEPIGSADALSAYQRAAADSCRVAFWNTYEAMRSMGGIKGFVNNKWAAGDYTHINYGGGRAVARALMLPIRDMAARKMEARERAEAAERRRLQRLEAERRQREEQMQMRLGAIADMADTLAGVTFQREE
ncbi:MAG: hypothetical protein K2F95_00220 [Alistipes sp.]|nr:hypothetical protein [Alistipes sp.]